MKKNEGMSREEKKKIIMEMASYDDMYWDILEMFEEGLEPFIIPLPPGAKRVKYRLLCEYCEEKERKTGKKVSPEDLSQEEMEQFLVY
ncbi:hypothetical protein [Lysinibacillus capsici]|jgi:hypothetical protein|uniref:hypothetical protein n=1 Tax=Lysinibacillus capsici TaxID=2115968 RepID=UPI003D7136CA